MGVEHYAVSETGIFYLGKGLWRTGPRAMLSDVETSPGSCRYHPARFLQSSREAMGEFVGEALEGCEPDYLARVADALFCFCVDAKWSVRLLDDSSHHDELMELEERLPQVATRYELPEKKTTAP